MGEDDLGFLDAVLAEYPDFILSQGEDFPEEDSADDGMDSGEDD